MGDLKKKKRTNKLRHELKSTIGDLDAARVYWRENTAKEAGMDIDEYDYDHRDYGTDEEDEREMGK
jgi:hypothetical protein